MRARPVRSERYTFVPRIATHCLLPPPVVIPTTIHAREQAPEPNRNLIDPGESESMYQSLAVWNRYTAPDTTILITVPH